jgi:hypothetical protein
VLPHRHVLRACRPGLEGDVVPAAGDPQGGGEPVRIDQRTVRYDAGVEHRPDRLGGGDGIRVGQERTGAVWPEHRGVTVGGPRVFAAPSAVEFVVPTR